MAQRGIELREPGVRAGNGTVIPLLWEDQTIVDGGIIFVLLSNFMWVTFALAVFWLLRVFASKVTLPILHDLEAGEPSVVKATGAEEVDDYDVISYEKERPAVPRLVRRLELAIKWNFYPTMPLNASRELLLARLPWGWLWAPLRFPPSAILVQYGPSAYNFVVFQWVALVLCIVLAFFSLSVILPINLSGGEIEQRAYSRTTISNLPIHTNLYWGLEVMDAFFFIVTVLALAVWVMLISRIPWEQKKLNLPVARISGIPRTLTMLDEEATLTSLRESFSSPEEMMSFNVVQNLKKLEKLVSKRVTAVRRRDYFQSSPELSKKQIHSKFWIFGRKKVASDFFNEKIAKIDEKLAKLREKGSSSLGIGFLTFRTRLAADGFATIMKRVHSNGKDDAYDPLRLKFDKRLGISNWVVRLERRGPQDVMWRNLDMSPANRWVRRVLIGVLVLLYLWVFTSPAVAMSTVKQFLSIDKLLPDENKYYWVPFHSLLFAYGPTLTLMFLPAPLPALLKWSAAREGWTGRAALSASLVQKAFVFMFFGFIFFPSVQSITLDAIVEQFLNRDFSTWERIGHVFLADSGAFFVNYFIQLAFFGCVLSLVPPIKFIWYAILKTYYKFFKTLTPLERSRIYVRPQRKFNYPFSYGLDLVVVGLTVIFCVGVPLLPVAAVIFFINRSLVDRFLIFYVQPQDVPADWKLGMVKGQGGEEFRSQTMKGVLTFAYVCLIFQQILLISFYSVRGYAPFTALHVILLVVAMALILLIPLTEKFCMRLQQAPSEPIPPADRAYSWLESIRRRYGWLPAWYDQPPPTPPPPRPSDVAAGAINDADSVDVCDDEEVSIEAEAERVSVEADGEEVSVEADGDRKSA